MPVYITLLRAVNVGKRQIKMDLLRGLYESVGFAGAQTLLQSGNVVFKTDRTDRAKLVKEIEAAIEKSVGFHSDVILRTPDEMRKVIVENPFPAQAEDDPSHLLVTFLNGAPTAEAIDALAKAHAGPEAFKTIGQDFYAYFPNGAGRTKLTITLIEKKLQAIGTARNWNTVRSLLSLAEKMDAS
jgi:uncharacterized protein (DUF1697 family)